MRTNFHTHTYRCNHAWGTEEDYVLEAIKNGLSVLGFSDHGPFPDRDFGLRMQYDELADYVGTINELKERFADRLKIYSGLEIEYHKKYNDYYDFLLKEGGLDYLVLGQHNYTDSYGDIRYISSFSGTEDYPEYAESVAEAIESGFFKIAAHPDIFYKNPFAWDENCEKAADIIIAAAERNKICLEVNANGFRRGKSYFPDGMRFQYPVDRFWKKVRGKNINVTVGSDCHTAEQLWDHHIDAVYKYCKDLRLNIIYDIFSKENDL